MIRPPLAWYPIEKAPMRVRAAGRGEGPIVGELVFVDCGAWSGDGVHAPRRRDFAIVSGEVVAMAELRREGFDDPIDLAEVEAIEPGGAEAAATLRAIAGRSGREAAITRVVRAPRGAPKGSTFVLLPDLRLPIVAELPDLDPNLIPDPARANCPCHGPFMARILGTARAAEPIYRAIGTAIGRNPNEWVRMLAAASDAAAEDLLALVGRLSRLRHDVAIVAVGPLFDVWKGFDCVFSASGRAAFLAPQIVIELSPEELRTSWDDKTTSSPGKDAVKRALATSRPRTLTLKQGSTFEAGALHVERTPFDGDAPDAALGLAEQKVLFRGWRSTRRLLAREAMIEAIAARWRASPTFSIFATAAWQLPALVAVEIGPA